MGKGSRNQTITNQQKLPDAVEAALEQAYTDFNPFDAAFRATSEFNPTAYDGPAMADFSALQNAALASAGNLVNRPDYVNQAQNTFTDFAQGNTGRGANGTGEWESCGGIARTCGGCGRISRNHSRFAASSPYPRGECGNWPKGGGG